MFDDSAPGVADIAAVTDNDRNSGWGGDGGWWVLIILFAIFGRGGNRGFGNGGYGTGDGTFNGGIPNGFALATDFASLERKMDGIDNGLCDGFHATANGMNTGFAAVQNALCRGFSGVDQAVTSQGYGSRLDTQAIRQQLAQCRCENEKQAMQTRFGNRQNHCATMQAIDKVGDRIVDYITNQSLKFQASQVAQNQYLTDTLRPCPSPAYITCNPRARSPIWRSP